MGPARGGLAVVDHAGELIALVKLYPRDVNFASFNIHKCLKRTFPSKSLLTTVSDLNVPLISEVNCGSRGSGSEKSEAENGLHFDKIIGFRMRDSMTGAGHLSPGSFLSAA